MTSYLGARNEDVEIKQRYRPILDRTDIDISQKMNLILLMLASDLDDETKKESVKRIFSGAGIIDENGALVLVHRKTAVSAMPGAPLRP